MSYHINIGRLLASLPVLAVWLFPSPALAGGREMVRQIDRMMVTLAPQSADASLAIRHLYTDYLNLLVLDAYEDVESALGNGGLVPLPPDALRFNERPRIDGEHPIGEMDLVNQASYVAARPATIGCLLDLAAQITEAPQPIAE